MFCKETRMKKLNTLTAKLISMGVIVGFLLIGNMMIGSKLKDREETRDEACLSISKAAGGRFSMDGLYVVVPYDYNEIYYDDGIKKTKKSTANIYFNPDKVNVDSVISTEIRQLGIYTSPVFTGTLSVNADFDLETLKKDGDKSYHPEKAYFLLKIGDVSLQSHPEFIINGKICDTYLYNDGIASKTYYTEGKFHLETELQIRGAEKFKVFVNAQDMTLNVKSDWTSPGFTGFDFLPSKKNIDENGFTATWNIPFASADSYHCIGFELIESVDVYKKLYRAINYGFLFIIVPFITLFLFEMFAGMQLHSVQYLLSGAASVIFFLLLLALSEHVDFGTSYMISGAASGILVSLYIASISRRIKIGLSMSGVFIALYSYLFVSLSSEDYALLIGSVFAFVVIAVLMFFTRKDNLGRMKKNTLTEDEDIESSTC